MDRPSAPFTQFEVLYSTQSFLTLKDAHCLPQEDVDFLRHSRCFHLPSRSIQEEFIYQYFLYLHPYYPLINEKDFWDMYLDRDTAGATKKTMPLLVFQAMLFSASSFVSSAVLKNAGYTNVKVARSIFYRRAKLLFDLGVETDAFTKAQAALLLTFQFSSVEPHAGSTWLAIGIQNAIVAQAHNFQAPGASAEHKKKRKMLWWSLFWRDRVVTLGLRKPLQITSSSFNVNIEPVTADDLIDELDSSSVYDCRTKRHLADILTFQCRLAIILTETLSICYGPNAFDLTYSLDNFDRTLARIRTAQMDLDNWRKEAEQTVKPFLSRPDVHRSTTLISSVIYIYAYAAQIALGNHEAMMIEQRQKGISILDDSVLRGIGKSINSATTETTKLVTFIVQEELTQHLPISAIAYIAFPLMLSSLDEIMSPRDRGTNHEELFTRYHAQAMHLCSQRFEGAVDISRMITQIVQSIPVQLPLHPRSAESESQSRKVTGESLTPKGLAGYWDDLFVTRNYMKLRLSLDYALITGRPPNSTDIPSWLLRDSGFRLCSASPITSLSAITLHRPRKRRASEGVTDITRVMQLGNKAATPEIDPSFDETTEYQVAARTDGRCTVSRPFFDYDTIWAASLFEEIADGIWS
ncbi:cutinase transcription factor 1 beta [Fusarium sporotrichioides]|uniref:Cutinase transcription factor 1 beta n=1 Tax=Fusarium sporotrichioides TaxID=5514 RepID=A0A395RR41_FUSSP|nr:cutinase transcription factor 1 beta [Fusarium sporotrichioides]